MGDSPIGRSSCGFPQGRGRHWSCGSSWPFLGGMGLPMVGPGRAGGRPCCCANVASPALYHFRKFEFNPKDGIDNPALSLTEDTGKYPYLPRASLCQHRVLAAGHRWGPGLSQLWGGEHVRQWGWGDPSPGWGRELVLGSLRDPAHGLCPHTDGKGVGEPRFYLLSKGSAETFGFCLHEELGCQGHVIRQVELGGLAQRRGLQDGDRLLQVNGHFVDHMDHRRVSWEHSGAVGIPRSSLARGTEGAGPHCPPGP